MSEAEQFALSAMEQALAELGGLGGLDPSEELELDEMLTAFAPVEVRAIRRRGWQASRSSAAWQRDSRWRDVSVARDGSLDLAILDRALRVLRAVATRAHDVPVASEIPGGKFAKHAIARLTSWYVGHVARQMGYAIGNIARVLEAVGDIVREQDAILAERSGKWRFSLPLPEVPGEQEERWWEEIACQELVARMSNGSGRVAHVGCRDGNLVARLRERDIDAYGIGATLDPGLLEAAVAEEVSGLRLGDPLEHLASVASGGLKGLVVSGVLEHLVPGEHWRVASLMADAVAPGGVLVVHSLSPLAWVSDLGGMAADLSPGHPLHAATWSVLLEELGLSCRSIEGSRLVQGSCADYLVIGGKAGGEDGRSGPLLDESGGEGL
jgi:SAM-dependent methyltransferase